MSLKCLLGHNWEKKVLTTMKESAICLKTGKTLTNKVYVCKKKCSRCGKKHVYATNVQYNDVTEEQLIYELDKAGIKY